MPVGIKHVGQVDQVVQAAFAVGLAQRLDLNRALVLQDGGLVVGPLGDQADQADSDLRQAPGLGRELVLGQRQGSGLVSHLPV